MLAIDLTQVLSKGVATVFAVVSWHILPLKANDWTVT